ncbi:hypothetical protein EDD18DRAFT_1384466 [Armillaria luteobubalina]|uniref:C2H2-type domain-containing protein n=1 Tax=Armillaria luteobubalina TaxID=153913 RepID=A0AA39Q724_9AGAR|nr:hypothetical protein EDD18DRAFT_1384466 [Armillaria luteobubalina]
MAKSLHRSYACGIQGCKKRVTGKNDHYWHIFTVHTKGKMYGSFLFSRLHNSCSSFRTGCPVAQSSRQSSNSFDTYINISTSVELIYTIYVQGISCEARSQGKNKFQCTECTWGANKRRDFTHHLKKHHADATSSSSTVKSTADPVSLSAPPSTRENRMEVKISSGSSQPPDALSPPATFSHDAPVTSPGHYTPSSALPQTTSEWTMGAGESTVDSPPSSQYSYVTFPPDIVSPTTSTLPSVAPAYYIDMLSSSSNTPNCNPNAYPSGIQARSSSRNIPVGTPLWTSSFESRFINFPQSNPYPQYPQLSEQQHLDANPAQSPDGTFGAVLPQVNGGGIMSPPYNFWKSDSVLYSSGVYQLDSKPDTVACTDNSNTLDSATNSQIFSHQYAP